MSETPVLEQIVKRCRERVAERRRAVPADSLIRAAPTPGAPRSFAAALRGDGVNVIAEFKRRSPSRGVIREDLTPSGAARQYEAAGAVALSVLTEPDFFGGSLNDLSEARCATVLPTLRKDFIVDEYQIWEARLSGADGVLLIVAALGADELSALLRAAEEAKVAALVEVHDADEVERALGAGANIIGVNNRDLRTMEVRLETSLDLAATLPADVVKVSESGIRTSDDISRLRAAGYDAFLIGERLMTSPDPGEALAALISGASVL
jgi:indole-3-glycerol phosphate synthase